MILQSQRGPRMFDSSRSHDRPQDPLQASILETSERKLQLIKQLLNPEEYNSIASELIDGAQEFTDRSVVEEKPIKDSWASYGYAGDEEEGSSDLWNLDKKIAQSEPREVSLEESLARKREALEFFFQEASDPTSKRIDLTIELRSSHYLSKSSEDEQKVLRSQSTQLFWQLPILSKLVGCSQSDQDELSKDEFMSSCERLNSQLYSNEHNLLTMRGRLEADGQLQKVNNYLRGLPQKPAQEDNLNHAETETEIVKSIMNSYAVQSLGSKPFKSNKITKLLKYHPKVESILHQTESKRDLSKLPTETSLFNPLEIKLTSMRITNHKLLLPEEKIAMKMIELQHEMDELSEIFDTMTSESIKSFKSWDKNDSSHDKSDKLRTDLERRLKAIGKLVLMNQQLIAAQEQLDASRRVQEFNSTSLTIKRKVIEASEGSIQGLFGKLVQKHVDDENFNELKQIQEQSNELYREYLSTAMELELSGLKLTPDNKCPIEEKSRRIDLKNLISRLCVRLVIGQKCYYNCCSRAYLDWSCGLDLSENFLSLPRSILTFDTLRSNAVLKVEISLKKHRAISFWSDLVVSQPIQMFTGPGTRFQSSKLLSLDGEIEFEFNFYSGLKFDASSNELERVNHRNNPLIDMLYYKVFNDSRPLEDCNMKLSRLMNAVEASFLLEYLGVESSSRYFVLDPYIDLFRLSAGGGFSVPEAIHAKASVRQALLVWRSINNLKQVVHLSEQDNIHNLSTRIEDFKAKLKTIPAIPESGYRSIEHIRLLALEYIKNYEQQLRELLLFNNEKLTRKTNRIEDILQEPQLEVDLSGITRMAKHFATRRTARRPLMPKRNLRNLNSGIMIVNHEIEPSRDADIEGHWGRMFSNQRLGGLKLLVTIQQATNVPMRVEPQHQSSSPRPFSPFYSTSPTPGYLQTVGNQPAVNLFSPPTTYVEICFQRKQQATSLSQGKNPSWNETLLFPVDIANELADEKGLDQTQHQLIEEYLQLNLYDYHCYNQGQSRFDLRPNQEVGDQHRSYPTTSNQLDQLGSKALVGASKLLSSKLKIERHLLGSLRVPLATLLSSGRIEGSFNLNQPLFLEKYQFEPEQTLTTSGVLISRTQSPTPEAKLDSQPETQISLFITLDPPVSLPLHLYLPTGSHETDQVFELARQWEHISSRHRHVLTSQNGLPAVISNQDIAGGRKSARTTRTHRKRHIRALVLHQDAKYSLICRFMMPLQPPPDLLDSNLTKMDQMRTLSRFVSLLNPLKYGLFNMRLLASSLWFDSVQLLNQSLGGPEEKAVLLCNYFLQLGNCSAILLGDAIPEGRCVYVIVWQEQSRFIENQLQLQATNLLETLSGNFTVGGQTIEGSSPLVNKDNFLSRLPILINSKCIQLWDPSTGRSYSPVDKLPLISVGSIVSMENAYANIQPHDSPATTNYDIRLQQFWFPLFESVASGTSSKSYTPTHKHYLDAKRSTHVGWKRQLIHLENIRKSVGRLNISPLGNLRASINYDKLSEDQCDELKVMIETTVKANLLKWRPNRPTYFNRTLSRLLAEKLTLFEGASYRGIDTKTDWKSELADLIKNEVLLAHLSSSGLNTRQVITWPVNLTYTSMKTILDSLFASGLHDADLVLDSEPQSTSGIQFLVACHVHPYPARVMSVWLYVAAVISSTRES